LERENSDEWNSNLSTNVHYDVNFLCHAYRELPCMAARESEKMLVKFNIAQYFIFFDPLPDIVLLTHSHTDFILLEYIFRSVFSLSFIFAIYISEYSRKMLKSSHRYRAFKNFVMVLLNLCLIAN
jgi:hypothetical protein